MTRSVDKLQCLHDEFDFANTTASKFHITLELVRADYVALGPIYETKLKAMKWAPQGLSRLAEWRARIGCPLVAICGITSDRAASVLSAGADSAAVVTDIVTSEDPDLSVKNWIAATAPWRRQSTDRAQA